MILGDIWLGCFVIIPILVVIIVGLYLRLRNSYKCPTCGAWFNFIVPERDPWVRKCCMCKNWFNVCRKCKQ